MDERDNSWKKKKQRTASKHVMVKSRFFSTSSEKLVTTLYVQCLYTPEQKKKPFPSSFTLHGQRFSLFCARLFIRLSVWFSSSSSSFFSILFWLHFRLLLLLLAHGNTSEAENVCSEVAARDSVARPLPSNNNNNNNLVVPSSKCVDIFV